MADHPDTVKENDTIETVTDAAINTKVADDQYWSLPELPSDIHKLIAYAKINQGYKISYRPISKDHLSSRLGECANFLEWFYEEMKMDTYVIVNNYHNKANMQRDLKVLELIKSEVLYQSRDELVNLLKSLHVPDPIIDQDSADKKKTDNEKTDNGKSVDETKSKDKRKKPNKHNSIEYRNNINRKEYEILRGKLYEEGNLSLPIVLRRDIILHVVMALNSPVRLVLNLKCNQFSKHYSNLSQFHLPKFLNSAFYQILTIQIQYLIDNSDQPCVEDCFSSSSDFDCSSTSTSDSSDSSATKSHRNYRREHRMLVIDEISVINVSDSD